MTARPAWQGHLKLSLVTCPVALFTTTSSSNDVRFHLINPDTHNRIGMVPSLPTHCLPTPESDGRQRQRVMMIVGSRVQMAAASPTQAVVRLANATNPPEAASREQ